MREQLIQYVELLFAGARDCEDIKQEILQNTLDRYDDLIAEGKVPEAAYRLAITGIGDINEILGTKPQAAPVYHTPAAVSTAPVDNDTPTKKLMRAIGVALYILCPIPLITLSELFGWDILGLCGTLAIVAIATLLMILGAKRAVKKETDEEEDTPKSALGKSISALVWAIGIAVYFIISFSTNYWHITWVIFPVLGALDKLLNVLLTRNEFSDYEVTLPANQKLRKSITTIINIAGLTLYFLLSFMTQAWVITWLVFPITAAVRGLVSAILDLKEAVENET